MLKVKICGVTVCLSLFYPAVFVVLLTLDSSGIPLWCLIASLMHEGGHLAALALVGSRPAEIQLGLFGVCIVQRQDHLMSLRDSILVALAGPFVNLMCAAVLLLCGGPHSLTMASAVHLAMGLMNLMPIEPLDGGQALFFALCRRLPEERAQAIVLGVSVAVLLPLAAGGFFVLLQSGYNFTLLAVSAYLGFLILFKRRLA